MCVCVELSPLSWYTSAAPLAEGESLHAVAPLAQGVSRSADGQYGTCSTRDTSYGGGRSGEARKMFSAKSGSFTEAF